VRDAIPSLVPLSFSNLPLAASPDTPPQAARCRDN